MVDETTYVRPGRREMTNKADREAAKAEWQAATAAKAAKREAARAAAAAAAAARRAAAAERRETAATRYPRLSTLERAEVKRVEARKRQAVCIAKCY